ARAPAFWRSRGRHFMTHELEFKNFDPSQKIRNLIANLTARIERKSRGNAQDPLFLRCALEEVPARKLFHVSIMMSVPHKVLAAKEEMHDAEAAIRAAFQEIERQLQLQKATLRGEHWWKRVQRRLALKLQRAGVGTEAASVEPQWFFALAEPHLEKLREVTGTVLRFLEARGDLPPHDFEVDDVVDLALTRAYDEFSKQGTVENVRSRLVLYAINEIDREVKRIKADRMQFVHVEDQELAEVLPEEEALGDAILDYLQLGDELRPEEIILDIDIALAKDLGAPEEVRCCVHAALNEISPDVRRALTLRYIVGLRGSELAKSLRKTPGEAEQLLDIGREALLKQLEAAGCINSTEDAAGDRRVA